MDNTKFARIFLGLNASFSLLMGACFLFAAGAAADRLFAVPSEWQTIALRILGIGLILFAVELLIAATNRFVTRKQVLLISAMDGGWIMGSVLLIAMVSGVFSQSGLAVIVVVAAMVAVFAIGQYIGAEKIREPLSTTSVKTLGNTIKAHVSRSVSAPQEIVWRVMNDHPGYADVADNISKVEVVGGEGMGMQRRCYGPKGENWLETCDLYEDGRAFGFRIHTEATDYPYPISDLHGEWSVRREGQGSRFAIDIEAKPKGNFIVQGLFKAAARRQFRLVLANLADAWAARMEQESRAQSPSSPSA